jgi:hypothetical protein
MSKYPVEIGDDEGVADALNYLLSGPGGLGQDFQGYEQWTPGWLTSNFRVPYSVLSYNAVCTGNSGEYTILVDAAFNTNNLQVGNRVTGYGIATGAVITAIGTPSSDGTVVTLDMANTDSFADGTDLNFLPADPPQIYVAPIALGTSTLLDPYTWKFEFASPQAAPPFAVGNGILVAGVTPSDYNGDYNPIGVSSCTTTYVIAKTQCAYTVPCPGSGGTVTLYNTSQPPKVFAMSTDCNSKITVQGGTDRVFISAQLDNTISYTATTTSDLRYAVAINRYLGFPNNNTANPGFYFQFDKLISKKVYDFPGLTGTGTVPEVKTIFSNFPDSSIRPGYYWYIMDVSFQVTNGGDLQVTQSEMGLRSMSTQVVKQ